MKHRVSKYALCVAALASLVSLAAFAKPHLLENIPLMWKPTNPLSSGVVQSTSVKVSFAPLKDVRQNPQLIAENREDQTPKPVTTKDDVGAFVATHMREIFDRNGVTTVDSGGDAIVSGEVRQFFVEETGTYQGQIALHVTVHGPSGKMLWEGSTSGTNSRFGRSYKAENYYETLSDSLIDATTNLLKDPEFVRALGHT
ncbi:MAG TPA: YajG family lipoprotein [Steroidobacteraceae bacterium]|jgi:hypothetical protein|nr:YajG family lipoprotein [Steroidobacteraceae bacterium]